LRAQRADFVEQARGEHRVEALLDAPMQFGAVAGDQSDRR
jgi:hypothetical protein